MAIASADILTRVNQITQRDLAQAAFNVLLLEACNEICLRTGALKGDASGTIAADSKTATAPTNMLSDESVITFTLDGKVIDPITYEEWEQDVKAGYVVYDGTIYVTKNRNTGRDYEIFYNRTHEAIGTNLEFSDIYQPAVVRLTAATVYDDFEISDRAQYQRGLFENELVKLPSGVSITHSKSSRIG